RGPQDELRSPSLHILAQPIENRRRITHNKMPRRIASGAPAIGFHHRCHAGIIPTAEPISERCTVMVLVNAAPFGNDGLLDRVDHAPHVSWRFSTRLPAGAILGGPPHSGLRRTTDPYR